MGPELTQEQADRLAEALIGEVVAEQLDAQRAEVSRRREQLRMAELAMARAQTIQDDWSGHRELDYALGERVVMNAKLADFSTTSAPPGTHIRAVRSYFDRHPPKLALERLQQTRRRMGPLSRLSRHAGRH